MNDAPEQDNTPLASDVADTEPQADETAVAVDENVPPAGKNESADASDRDNNLQHLLSMKVPVIVKVAQKKMTIESILKLNLGTVIQFDKDAYQLIDLMVNNSTIGLGQPVKVGENFGLRITQIGDLSDTIRSLGGAPAKDS